MGGGGTEVIGVRGANGRADPPAAGTPAASRSTNLGFHGPAINKITITVITTTAAAIAQLILFIRTSLRSTIDFNRT
jgi:hypothetical protein